MAIIGKSGSLWKQGPGLKEIIWIIVLLLAGAFMIYGVLREKRDEEKFQDHIKSEHKQTS